MTAVKKVINAWEVKPLCEGDIYESRMILDNIVAGEPTVQINHGTVRPGKLVGGGAHKKTEIYFIVAGHGKLQLDEDYYDVKQGSLAIIPGGCIHSIRNLSETEDLILLTFWMNAEDNETYVYRLKQWGKSFKTIYED